MIVLEFHDGDSGPDTEAGGRGDSPALPLDNTFRYPYDLGTEMIAAARQTNDATTAALIQLLPELVVTLYQSAPHARARRGAPAARLTGRQMKAVVFLAHRGPVTMGEFAAGLEIGRAAASELAARLVEKGVVRRAHDPADRRVVTVTLSARAEGLAADVFAEWSAQIAAAFALHPGIDPDTLVAFLRTVIAHLKGRPGS